MALDSSLALQPLMPPQKLPFAEKDEHWQKKCIDAVTAMGYQSVYNGRDSQYRKQINYDLVNSIFDEADFSYVLNPYNLPSSLGGNPAKIQDFNIIRSKIETLKGEELEQPFNFLVVCTGGEAMTVFEEKKKQFLLKSMEQYIQAQAAKDGLTEPPTDDQGNPVAVRTPEEAAAYFDSTYKDIREKIATRILQYGEKKEKFPAKFNKGWEHALVSAEEIYYVGIVDNEPVMRVVNPMYFDFDKNPDLEFIEDSQWAREVRYLASGQILDEFHEFLTDDQVKKLDEGMLNFHYMSGSRPMMYPGYAYNPEDFRRWGSNWAQVSHIPVVTCVWRSMREIGFLRYQDDDGSWQETIVDETFTFTSEMKDKGWTIKWEWVNEVWKGTRIGKDTYVDIAPMPNQYRNMDNPSLAKLPYIGRVYNMLNSKATSIVDLCKPHQYTYIIVWYRLMMELAKAKGKKMVFDFAAIPKSQGIDIDRWMYYFDNLGIAFINSFEEGTEAFQGRSPTERFNQYTAIDMSLSQVVQQYMMILEKLELMVSEICGISKQREGDIAPQETVGGVQTSIIQSSKVTAALYFYHNEVKKQVLTQYLKVAKMAYKDGKKMQFILDDMYRVFMEVDGDLFSDSEYGVFVSNTAKDLQVMDKLQNLAQVALQSDKAKLSDLITVFKSQSISEIESTIKTSEERAEQLQMQEQQVQQQLQQSQQQHTEDLQQQKLDWEANQNELDRESKERIAEIQAMGMEKDEDFNGDNIPDALEVQKLVQKTIDDQTKRALENRKLDLEEKKIKSEQAHEKQLQNKKNEIELKKIKAGIQTAKYKSKAKPKS